ncbi:nucleoside-diphosphate-sugar epimerase [Methylohalomonas lacus]|uniref:Nucleoside-diphosphate-sugar epimerase n=1 Tax=Methylohalomonas lacus TaxID=398773 RepID=A0AAE3HM69_9GAMM|nr:NAD-dependent epimerase/dehydratase family protein [Methylohalomonas lacus]MCS3904385.1 nucleoside-diphosphate-sugar epimerase [Methylohalomonas lacus]
MRVAVTGANGFIGRAVLRAGQSAGLSMRALVRTGMPASSSVDEHWIGEIGPDTEWSGALSGVDAVVHLAGAAHTATDAYERVNTEGTLRLGRCAVEAGVRRLVFVSSIAVYPAGSGTNETIDTDTRPAPSTPYGGSKWRAEQGLWEIASATGMEVVVVRPALVVGPGAPGNLRRLAALVARGLPLPVPSTANARSYVSLESLADLLLIAARHPAAAGNSFLAADATTPSTRQVIQWIGEGMGRPARVVPVPDGVLSLASRLVGQSEVYRKLYGNLCVDAGRTRDQLDWSPGVSLEAAFRSLGAGFHREQC